MAVNKIQAQEQEVVICDAAEQFCKLYYEAFDKRRQMVPKFYITTACMVWNGNPLSNQAAIENFLINLPDSETCIKSLDAQPICEKAAGGQNTMLVLACGTIRLGARTHSFSQTFMLTAQGEKWRIASDRFRFCD